MTRPMVKENTNINNLFQAIMRKKDVIKIFVHVAVWLMVFGLPLLMLPKSWSEGMHHFIYHNLITCLGLLLVFYANYFGLIKRFLFKKKNMLFYSSNLVMLVVVALLSVFLKSLIEDPRPPRPEEMDTLWRYVHFFVRDFLSLVMTVGLSVAIRVTGHWHVIEMERQEAEHRQREAELYNLRQQLNPHFLFNTLNNIYALVTVSPERAQEAILELSKLLRYVLYDNEYEYVDLNKEIEFVSNYVELMRLRLAADVDVRMNVQVEDEHIPIAPLLFISLVENAFKHGISSNQPSFVHIDIVQGEHSIDVKIDNSYFPKTSNDHSGSGIGLENLRRRLAILYPQRYELTTTITPNNTYSTELRIAL